MPELLIPIAWAVLAVFAVRFVVGYMIEEMGWPLEVDETVMATLFGALAILMAPLYILVLLYKGVQRAFRLLPGNQTVAKWARWFFTLDRDERKKVLRDAD